MSLTPLFMQKIMKYLTSLTDGHDWIISLCWAEVSLATTYLKHTSILADPNTGNLVYCLPVDWLYFIG